MATENSGNFIRGDISKLSNKEMNLPKQVQDRAFLGRENESLHRRQIVGIADSIKKENLIGNPGDSQRDIKAQDLLKRNFNKNNVKDIENQLNDPNLTVSQKQNIQRDYERLGKAVYLSLRQSDYGDNDLAQAGTIDNLLPESFKGIEKEVMNCIIKNEGIVECLNEINYYKNELNMYSYDQKKEMLTRKIDSAIKKIAEIGCEEGKKLNQAEKEKLFKEKDLAVGYLVSLNKEVDRNQEDETITDSIVEYLDNHVLRKDVVLDEDFGLISAKATILVDSETGKKTLIDNDNFEKIPGTDQYKNPDTVKWLKEREQNAVELIRICSGGEFESIEEINEKLKESGLVGSYIMKDGNLGNKEYLEGLKDVLGFCVYETIEKSKDKANRDILGTLNTNWLEKILPYNLSGLGDEIVTNVVTDPFIKSQLRLICELDKDKAFSLLRLDGNYSGMETKNEAIRRIQRIIEKVTGSNRMGQDTAYTKEAKRVNDWLLERNKKYEEYNRRQERLRNGLNIPEDIEGKFKMARELLNYVEESGSPPGSLNIMNQTTSLFEMTRYITDSLEKVKDETEKNKLINLKTEIKARLNLAFMYYHMHAAGGLIGVRGQSIDDAIEQGYKEGCLLDKEILTFFFRDGANGIPVAEFWDALEEINFFNKYEITLTKIMNDQKFLESIKDNEAKAFFDGGGVDWKAISPYDPEKRTYRDIFIAGGQGSQAKDSAFWRDMQSNMYVDGNGPRVEIVKKYLKEEVQKKTGIDDPKLLDKGYELAEKLLVSTGENAVFNPCFAGHDDLAELVLTECYEKDARGKHKAGRGMLKPMSRIVSIMTTWPRFLAGEIVDPGKNTVIPKDVIGKNLVGHGPLKSSEFNWKILDGPKSDSYFFYCALMAKKVLPIRDFMRKAEYDAKDVLRDEVWNKLYDGIDKLVKYGQNILCDDKKNIISRTSKDHDKNFEDLKKELQFLTVQSVVESAAAYWWLNWDLSTLDMLGDIVTQEYTLRDETTGRPKNDCYISKAEWEKRIYAPVNNDISKFVGRRLKNKNLSK